MSPPERPAKKSPEEKPIDGIDLSDFDEGEGKVAGLKVDDDAPPRAPKPVAPSVSPATAPPTPPTPAAPLAPPAPPRAAPAAPAARPTPPPAVAKPAAPLSPQPPAPSVPAAASPPPPPLPRPATPPPASAPPTAPPPLPPAPSAPSPPFAVPPPYAPPAAPPPPQVYAAPVPYFPPYSPYPAYPPYPGYAPGPAFPPTPGYPPQPYYAEPPPPPRPPPSPTAESLARLGGATTLAIGFFAILTLQHVFEAASGVTDSPGARSAAPLGLQFIDYFLLAGEGVLATLAVALGSSALARLNAARAEFSTAPAAALSPRTTHLLALGLAVPLAAGFAAWLFMNGVQSSLPGTGTGSDPGLARLFENYRFAALTSALGGLASAFLLSAGLKSALSPARPLAPAGALRAFGALFVLGAALNAALVLVLYFVALSPPTTSALVEPEPLLSITAAGPALACLALYRLRVFLLAASKEAASRHRAKSEPKPAPA